MKIPATMKQGLQTIRARVRFKRAGLTLPGSPYMQDDTAKIRQATKKP